MSRAVSKRSSRDWSRDTMKDMKKGRVDAEKAARAKLPEMPAWKEQQI